MSSLCCRSCRVRFTAAASEYLLACPECDAPATPAEEPRMLVGFRLFDPLDDADARPDAVAVALPAREPHRRPPRPLLPAQAPAMPHEDVEVPGDVR